MVRYKIIAVEENLIYKPARCKEVSVKRSALLWYKDWKSMGYKKVTVTRIETTDVTDQFRKETPDAE